MEDGGGSQSWSLEQVFGPNLDPSKTWYALSKDLCGILPRDFAKNAIFVSFPGEIAVVSKKDLSVFRNGAKRPFEATTLSENGAPYQRQPKQIHVATTFGLFMGFERQRDFPRNEFHQSPIFKAVFDFISRLHFANVPENASCMKDNSKQTPTLSSVEEPEQSTSGSSKPKPKQKQTPFSSNNDNPSVMELETSPLGPTKKKKAISRQCSDVMNHLNDVAEKYRESLASVLGNALIYGSESEQQKVRETVSEIAEIVLKNKGNQNGLARIFTDETYHNIITTMKVADWALLYFKLHSRIPDAAWQTLLNITHLGKSRRKMDTPLIMTKNQVKAIKALVFRVIKDIFKVQRMDTEFDAYSVDLNSVLVWAIREARLHSFSKSDMEFNIKLDGRPLGGRNQVAIGIVPIHASGKSSESSLSVYPIAIANCKEERRYLKQLLSAINAQKNHIKKNGIVVDGYKYQIKFTVTMDYKALLLLLAKKDNEDFILGGKGYSVEFCAFCDAIRACTDHGADPEETCTACLKSKAQIGRCTGLRDDLEFLLDEDLSTINLCSLHCELRNTEQLLGTLGLQAYRIGTLDKLNESISGYGPEKDRGFNRITIKEREGKQTEVSKADIKVASFSGSTEREILKNLDTIVRTSLPLETVAKYYMDCQGSADEEILNYLAFFEERKEYLMEKLDSGVIERDYGSYQKKIAITDCQAAESFIKKSIENWDTKQKELATRFVTAKAESEAASEPPKKKRKKKGNTEKMPPVVPSALDYLAAEIRVELFVKVCADWRAIAMTMREETFDGKGQEEIDIYDIKCKEWGFLLKKLFGIHLGTGDYGHLVIDHSAMLLRQFHSFYHYSGQGFESSHKLHRQLYARATNHDASGPGQSLEQILTHWYSTHLLHLRYMFSEAKKCIESGKKKFPFRGCGWPANASCTWSTENKQWITVMEKLFCNTFGEDFLEYKYDSVKGTSVAEHITNNLVSYNHDTWERDYLQKIKKEQQAVKCSETPPSTPTQPVSVSHGPTMPTPPDSTGTSPISPETPPSTPTQPVSVSHGPTMPTPPDSTGTSPISSGTPPSTPSQPVSVSHGPTMPTPPDSTGTSPISPGTPLSSQKSVKDAMAHLSQFTRWELASLYDKIPKVGTTHISNMQVLYGSFIETDPFALHTRPGDQIISDASSMLHQNAKQNPTGIYINGYGKFSSEGLAMFRKFSFLSDIKMRVSSEVKWLERNNCLAANEMDKVKKALWHTKHSQPIIRFERKSIDPMNYSDIIGERYIDNFTIDICIGKYIEEVANKGCYDTLYLPSEFFCWMASNDKSLKLQKLSERLSLASSSTNFTQILVPIHFDQASHWGLLYVDLPSNQIMFDDGMKFSLPLGKLPKVKEALYLLLELCPSNKLLENKFWENTTLQRFGMPQQTGSGSPIGGGSCGLGVILAARDFVMHGVSSANNIKWTFNEMNIHRARLLAKIASGW